MNVEIYIYRYASIDEHERFFFCPNRTFEMNWDCAHETQDCIQCLHYACICIMYEDINIHYACIHCMHEGNRITVAPAMHQKTAVAVVRVGM